MKPICVIDNYDSFTYNLVHILEAQGCTVEVFRNDQFELEQLDAYDKILLSPGPGIPDEAGLLKAVIRQYAPSKSILGICLGHQAIGEVFGGEPSTRPGVSRRSYPIVQHQEDVLFEQLSNTFEAGRYHSWVVAQPLPGDLVPLAYDEQHQLMALNTKPMRYGAYNFILNLF